MKKPIHRFIEVAREFKRAGSRILSGEKLVPVDYPLEPNARYGHGRPPLQILENQMKRFDTTYEEVLEQASALATPLRSIPMTDRDPSLPCWENKFLGGLDTVALYTMLTTYRPNTYLEIGSGYSSRVARFAIEKESLSTKVVSIDPNPRAEIDYLCDEVIREPLEKTDLNIFSSLEQNDIVFYDGSHRSYMNSDVTVFFLEVLPRLKPGVVVQIHDIFLPYDYPPEWQDRYYSEQYLLATYLLADGQHYDILLPNYYVSQSKKLKAVMDPFWKKVPVSLGYRGGVSFWMLKR